MEIEAIIFDLDGTLLHSIEDIANAANTMLINNGFPVHAVDKYITWIGNGAQRLISLALPLEWRNDDAFVEKCLKEYSSIYALHILDKSVIYKDMDKILDFLSSKNIPFSVLTNKPQALTDAIYIRCFSDWGFNFFLGQVNEHPPKPDPTVALRIAICMGAKPENTLMIGDSITDLHTAEAAGMMSLLVGWGYGNTEAIETLDYDFKVNQPSELLHFFNTTLNFSKVDY